MDINKLDKHFQNKLDNYESPIDSQEIWANVSKTVSPKSNLRYWFFGVIGTIAFASAMYWFVSNQSLSETGTASNQVTIDKSASISFDQKENTNTSVHSDGNTTSNITKGQELLAQESFSNDSKQIATQEKKNIVSAIQENKSNQKISTQTNTTQSHTTKNTTSDNVQNTINTTASNTTNEIAVAKNIIVNEDNSDAINESTQNELLAEESNQFTSLQTSQIGILGLAPLRKQSDIGLNFPDPIECPSFSKKKGHFSLLLHAIPYYSMPMYNPLNEEGKIWMNNKKEYESYLEAFQVNLLGQYQWKNGLYVQAGVGYGQIDEKLDFLNISSYDVEEVGPTIIIIYGDGQPNDTIEQTRTVTYYDTTGAETYNYHRMVEIPIALGYEFRGGNLGFYIDAGVSINVLTSRTGYTYLAGEAVAFDDPDYNLYGTSTGLKVNGSAGVIFYPTNRFAISIGPDIRYHTQNWLHSSQSLEQRYLDIGLRLGMKYLIK